MARKAHQIEINEDSSDEDLELVIAASKRSGDVNIQRNAARATVIKTRRERQFEIEKLNAQENARVKGQKFQAAQSERTEEAMASSEDVDPRNVMVVYGRDEDLRASMFDFLRSLQLNPIEWEHAVKETGSASPNTIDVVVTAFEMAMGVVVLLTGEDLVKLHPELVSADDPDYESKFLLQPRPNVLLEAGMALALNRDRTVPVVIGDMRQISDIAGINFIRLDDSAAQRNALAGRLKTAGCSVNTDGKDWLKAGNFEASRTAPVGPEEDEAPKPAYDLSDEEISILKALFENEGIPENALAGVTGLGAGKVKLWIGELLAKGVIHQTRASSTRGGNEFSISPGQTEMLRQVGVM